ncbi:hypothetical protein C2E21_9022 [Chlorella sorokiniana]|uniref:Uncharacterized protein n=1 Tax=Chlorella sorokiniana TaxID=3076 RepID=A0A2P6TCL9_CHLSO|nr:hypothetical protein C2E21_9022 [Chlorella sorokiniana]|eukprot:PRW20390.1 hypothetical protein C2E21_9022 [Chlorella sorokiniana]
MKNALVKQTQEAVKRSTQLAPPPARQRLGTRARQAAAAAAATAADAEAQLAGEEDTNSEAAFFCDELHQELEHLLAGGGLAQEAAASLAAAQEALGAGRDATRLPPGDLSLPVEGELAPPPFDALVQQLFGTEANASQQPAAASTAPLPPEEAAGLAAAVRALQLHSAELESSGMLDVAGAAADSWLLPDSSSGAEAAGAIGGLPAYLQGAQLAGGGQLPFQVQQQQRQQPGPDAHYQHWPATGVGAMAAAESHDAIQEADEAPDWGALEGDAFAAPRRPALQLNLPAQRPGGEAAGGVLVSFDDDQQQQYAQQQQQAWQPGQNAWQAGGKQQQQAQQQGQVTLSDIWEGGEGGMDPWMDVADDSGPPHWQQQEQQQWQQPGQQQGPPGALRVPTFASRPCRQQLALSHSQQQHQQAGYADEGIEDEDWDEGMLEQVAALEQQALLQRQLAQPSGLPPQQEQQGKRHVPVFRNRAFQQKLPAGAWPAESIENADSDEEPGPAPAGPSQAADGGAQRVAAGAVPQLGRRGALPLAGQAAAAEQARASDDEDGGQTAGAVLPQQRPAQRAPAAAAGAAGAAGQQALLIDFSAIDVVSLRPSVLLRPQAGGRLKWRPVFDPEQLLLQPLRSALRPPPAPPTQRQPAGGSHWLAAGGHGGQAASDLLAGITAADLQDCDDWGEEEDAAAGDGAGFDGGGWDEAAWQGPADSPAQQQQQQQQQPVTISLDEPAAVAEPEYTAAAAPAATLSAPAAAAASPAALTVRFQPLVELAFDYDEGGSEPEAEPQQEQSQLAYGTSQPPSQQQAAWPSQAGSMGGWAAQPDAGGSAWQQGFGWQAPQPQDTEPVHAAAAVGDPWAGLEQAADEQGGQELEALQPAGQAEAAAAQRAEGQPASAASPAAAEAANPWAVLGGDVEDAAADGWAGGAGWFSQPAATAAEAGATAVVDMAADPPAGAYAGDGTFGGWALDVEWEDAGPAADEPPAAMAQQLQQQQQREDAFKAALSGQGPVADIEVAETATAMGGGLEWQYDEPEQATEPAAVVGAGSLAARLATLGVLDPAVPAAAAAAAGKRRHEQIGAEIIQALLEERRRARVDLQPLLQQLSSCLAHALAGGSGSGPSGSSGSGAAEAATLSAVRQACLNGGGPGVQTSMQASMQRYLVALLTAAHQHNSVAAAAVASEAEGSGAAAPAAAVAPLAAALAGKQLLLHAPGGATDIQIAAA